MLYEKVLKRKQDVSGITINPILDAINIEECQTLDTFYGSDAFIKDKIDKCIGVLDKLGIDFHPEYRTVYEEYSEAITYWELKKKYDVTRVPEAGTPTPDFHVKLTTGKYPFDIYAEVKTLSFLDGNLNYKEAEKSGVQAKISSEEQLKREGATIGFGEAIISPFLKNNKLPTTTELIEIYIRKIENNIKEGQFDKGDTILMIDIKQLLLQSYWDESAIAIYQEGFTKSMVSGVLWNMAFGKENNLIYKPIDFEGKPNIDSPLTKNGILVDYPFVKGIVVAAYKNFQERKYIGFFRHEDHQKQIAHFITDFCEFYNDDLNTNAFRILQNRK